MLAVFRVFRLYCINAEFDEIFAYTKSLHFLKFEVLNISQKCCLAGRVCFLCFMREILGTLAANFQIWYQNISCGQIASYK